MFSFSIFKNKWVPSFFVGLSLLCFGAPVMAADCPEIQEGNKAWQATAQKACGQIVKFHAWGGADNINDYISWAGKRIKEIYGVHLKHVKISNTADSVQLVLAAKTAGKNHKGAVDMIWINGENFRKMKQENLLFGPFTKNLPNFKYVDTKNKPTTLVDFTIPTEGYESPWGMAQLVFIYDSAHVKTLPKRMSEFLVLSKANPGRLTYPAPPDFLGVTFLKQALIEMTRNKRKLQRAPGQDADKITAPLWRFLDELHPNLWQKGKNFPKDWPSQNQLLADGEVHYSLAFNPNDASSGILRGQLPKTVRTFVMKKGTIGNTHFVAVPYNSDAKEGAQIVANFLLSAEAQQRKADPKIWGDPTVLNVSKLPSADRTSFNNLPLGQATLSAEKLGKVLPEPHPEWSNYLRQQWLKRYGS